MASDWTYESQVDLTNGGSDNLTSITIASGLPAGITDIEVMYTLYSTDEADQGLIVQLGDSGGIETSGYLSHMQNATSATAFTDGIHSSRQPPADAADFQSGVIYLIRWDVSEHLWFASITTKEAGSASPLWGAGLKTLSGEITQLLATTSGGTAQFDSGEIRVRHR